MFRANIDGPGLGDVSRYRRTEIQITLGRTIVSPALVQCFLGSADDVGGSGKIRLANLEMNDVTAAPLEFRARARTSKADSTSIFAIRAASFTIGYSVQILDFGVATGLKCVCNPVFTTAS